ncbi:inovirus Gp2 family protein [Citrobacter braakii]|uniref:inovirus Gp2 family protein n=1 Tax=Citrobacter braakii TaxID=57706 RepID=UPI00242A7872|nr:inovirus Gp2 family protein [Citrobacter braakii]WFW82113.1 inovirus Gp2 family protein [Citrobacter braakii]
MEDYSGRYGDMSEEYLKRIQESIHKAQQEYPRLLAIRVDFRLPIQTDKLEKARTDSSVITRCMKSLKERIKADLKRKKKAGKRTYPCRLRYVWVREFNLEGKKHYHALLLLNKDAYFHPGDFNKDSGTLASMIAGAWVSSLGLSYPADRGLVHFPTNGYYHLNNKGQKEFNTQMNTQMDALKFRTAYMAKVATKSNEDGERNFGCSQN